VIQVLLGHKKLDYLPRRTMSRTAGLIYRGHSPISLNIVILLDRQFRLQGEHRGAFLREC
jgi:hypothetical protein